ncbi:MAG: polyprenyl synthetase family protein [Planctomycetes bacterium]|nr:polyprenyl synthetase family protein [Planctomycetota bacterium]
MKSTLAPAQPRTSASLFAPIAADLDEVERILRQTLNNARPGVDRLLAHLAHYKGKRLRPALLLLTALACGKVTSAHHLLAAVVEMIHTATLVHDDVLDSASVRRHVSTVNSLWGNQTSILLGDYLFTHAFHLSSTLDDVRACRIIGEATNRLCAGELQQICGRGNIDLSEDEYFAIIDAKTAELTACSSKLGAMYAGMSDEVIDRMTNFGRSLGLAFQIADDVLDLIGEETLAGKSLGTDLEQQKLTLPIIHLLQSTSPEQARRGRSILTAAGNHKREALLPELHAAGSLEYARQRAEGLVSSALADLECLPPSPGRSILEALADRVVHRDH